MARITVEDCLTKIPNRFQLVLAATYRARMLSQGHSARIESKNKPGVTALREIAAGEAARELLAREGLSDEVSVEAITDPSRGLYLSVSAPADKAETAERLLKTFPVKVELRT